MLYITLNLYKQNGYERYINYPKGNAYTKAVSVHLYK